MFDAKSLLDQLMRGNTQASSATSQGDAAPLEELLRNLRADPNASRSAAEGAGSSGGSPLGDLLEKLQQQAGPGGLADILGQVLGQATTGVREGAQRIDDSTGASARIRDAMGQMTGRNPEDLIAQIKELIASNRLGTGAALGGLGALILGSGAGRSLAASAVRLGGLALIGGLAYRAYQNHQQGRSPLTGREQAGTAQPLLAAPEGSGFEASAASNDQATVLIRAMIAAAAADGRIDPAEHKSIMSGLQQSELGVEARTFLAGEFDNPATIEELAEAATSPEEAVRIYTAARIAVDVDSNEEHDFLAALARRLDIDQALVAHIDAAARSSTP